MSGLDPALASAREMFGRPRFYPHGKHPATERLRAHITAVERMRERCVRGFAEANPSVLVVRPPILVVELAHDERDRWRGMIEQADEMLEYLRRDLALFEEGESIAKADYLRTVERRR